MPRRARQPLDRTRFAVGTWAEDETRLGEALASAAVICDEPIGAKGWRFDRVVLGASVDPAWLVWRFEPMRRRRRAPPPTPPPAPARGPIAEVRAQPISSGRLHVEIRHGAKQRAVARTYAAKLTTVLVRRGLDLVDAGEGE